MSLPAHIPALPELLKNDRQDWSPNVLRTFSLIDRAYGRSLLVIQEGEQDAHCLRIHGDTIVARIFPLLDALEREGMQRDWVRSTGELLASMVLRLEHNAHEVDNMYVPISNSCCF